MARRQPMNGAHDMGGMQCFGPVRPEKNAPAFHEPWEARIVALSGAVGATGKTRGNWRLSMESLPPADYLRMSYYERWLRINEQLLVKHGVVRAAEMATGTPDPGSAKTTPAFTAAAAACLLGRDIPSSHDPQVPLDLRSASS